jgi:hypothetical protein
MVKSTRLIIERFGGSNPPTGITERNSMIAQQYNIRVYEDENTIRDVINKLSQVYPMKKTDGLLIPFDNEGSLLREGRLPGSTWDYATRKYISTNKTKIIRDNTEFVDAIKFEEIAAFGSRKGRINFTHPDGRTTCMSFKHFKEIANHLVRGWLIGRFTYGKFYGAFGIQCTKVLV